MTHTPSIPALLIAASSGLIALTRTVVRAPRTSSRHDSTAPTEANSVMAYGSLSKRLQAGKKVKCVLSARSAAIGCSDTSTLRRFTCEGIIVALQPTRGRCGYQDVSVVVANPDFSLSPASSLVVESIG